jgi:hypothetical protein
MIQFSANIQACLDSDNIEAFYLLRITYSNGTPISPYQMVMFTQQTL